MEGEFGVVAVKIESDILREGSEKDRDEVRLLEDGGNIKGVRGCERGGKSTREVNDGKFISVVCEEGDGKVICVRVGALWGGGLSENREDLQAM